MYSRRVWERGANAKDRSRRAPYARWASQAEAGQGGLVLLHSPVLHRRRRGGVLCEDLLVRLHHVRVVEVVVHDHPALALKQNQMQPVYR